jgi:hypothetical protein
MPARDHDEREAPQAGAELLEYIARGRLHEVRRRRQRRLMHTTVALGLLAAILAVSNVILLKRLNADSEAPPPASVASAQMAATPEPAAPAPPLVAPALPPDTPAPPPAPSAPEPVAIASGPPAPALPGASAPATSGQSAATPRPVLATPSPVMAADEGDSALRTARWLIQTHGRLEAENLVAKVAEFYTGAEGAFWQRVLLNVRQEPER